MNNLMKSPYLVVALSLFLMWLSVRIGVFLRKGPLGLAEDLHHDLDLTVAATRTLLGLINVRLR